MITVDKILVITFAIITLVLMFVVPMVLVLCFWDNKKVKDKEGEDE